MGTRVGKCLVKRRSELNRKRDFIEKLKLKREIETVQCTEKTLPPEDPTSWEQWQCTERTFQFEKTTKEHLWKKQMEKFIQ